MMPGSIPDGQLRRKPRRGALRILVAGASEAVGRALKLELVARWHVTDGLADRPGTLPAETERLTVGALDRDAVLAACVLFAPDVIFHELTARPATTSLRRFHGSFVKTNRLGTEGTRLSAGDGQTINRQTFGWSPSYPSRRAGFLADFNSRGST